MDAGCQRRADGRWCPERGFRLGDRVLYLLEGVSSPCRVPGRAFFPVLVTGSDWLCIAPMTHGDDRFPLDWPLGNPLSLRAAPSV